MHPPHDRSAPDTPSDTPPRAPSNARADLLRAFLDTDDTPCPGCGYNLRGLTNDVCPECAQRLHLAVGLVEPKIAAFITGLIGLSAGLGFHAIFLIFIAWIALFNMRGGLPPGHIILTLIIGAAIEGLVMHLWLRSLAKLRRATPRARWSLALGCWALSAISVSIFFAGIG